MKLKIQNLTLKSGAKVLTFFDMAKKKFCQSRKKTYLCSRKQRCMVHR